MSINHDAPAWSRRSTRGEMTTGEGEIARRMRDRCVAELRKMADDLRKRPAIPMDTPAHYDLAADVIARLEPEEEITGLHYRGG